MAEVCFYFCVVWSPPIDLELCVHYRTINVVLRSRCQAVSTTTMTDRKRLALTKKDKSAERIKLRAAVKVI